MSLWIPNGISWSGKLLSFGVEPFSRWQSLILGYVRPARLGWQKVTYCTEKVLAARHQRRLPRSDYPVGSGEFIHKLMRCHFILISCLAHLNWISSRLSAELFTSAVAPWHDVGIDHEEFKQLPQAVFQFTWFLSSPGIRVVGVTTLFINYINVGGMYFCSPGATKQKTTSN